MLIKNSAALFKNCLLLLILAAPLYALYLTLSQSTNIPFWDAYNQALHMIIAIKNHSFGWHRLIASEETHRPVIDRILFIVSYDLFSGNVLFFSFITFVSLISSLAILSQQLENINVNKNTITGLILIASFSWLLFQPQANQYWYWTLIIEYPLTIVFYILALHTLCKEKPGFKSFLISLLYSYLASYSCANGLLLWPVILVGMILLQYDKKWIFLYALIALLTIILYLKGSGTASLPAPLYIRLLYIICFLGNIFFYNSSLITSIIMGGIGLIIYLCFFLQCLTNKDLQRRYLFWLLLPGLSIGSAVLASIGRIWGTGFISIGASEFQRYYLLSAPFWCGCIVILLTYYWKTRIKALVIAFFLSIIVLYSLTATHTPEPDPLFINAVDNIKTEGMALRNNYYIINTEQTNTSLWPYYSLRDMVLGPLAFLKQQHFNLFKQPTWKIIGQPITQFNLKLGTPPFEGSFTSVNQSIPTNYNVLDYGFLPGLESFGTAIDNRSIEMIYLIGPKNIVYGLAIPEYHTRYKENGQFFILWHGFTAANLICQQTKLQAYVKLKNNTTLYPIGKDQTLERSSMCPGK